MHIDNDWTIKDSFGCLGFIIMSIGMIILFLYCIWSSLCQANYNHDHPIYYTYKDFEGNIGETNKSCSNYQSILTNQASMTCILDDGTVIQVLEYKEERR